MIRIKICGITSPADAAMVVESGADAIGLNFSSRSPRCVEWEASERILDVVGTSLVKVGVFVETISPVSRLTALQTYRDPPWDNFQGIAHIPAFRIRQRDDVNAIQRYLQSCVTRPAAVLVDSHSPGSGTKAPWELLAGFDPGVPLMLAGGLTPDNVAEAIRIVKPYGVDVASGVEEKPGVKDPVKVRDFVQAAKAAFSAL